MWLTLILIGVALLLLGVFVEAAKVLIWIGLVIAVFSVVMWIIRAVGRGAAKV